MTKRKIILPAIDILRAIALMMVLYQHTLSRILIKATGIKVPFNFGFEGVALFFILSGFVLYQPYLLKQREIKTKADFLNFYKKRFIRLYPALIVNLVILNIVNGFNRKYFESSILVISLLSQFSVVNFFPLINAVLWTLVIEIMFSLIFPFLIYIINKITLRQILIGTLVLSLFIRALGINQIFYSDYTNPIRGSILGVLDDFIVGMYLCELYFNNKLKFNISYFPYSILFFIFAGLLFEISLSFYELRFLNLFSNNFFQLSFVFLSTALLTINNSNIILKSNLLRSLGKMCYSFYLWHVPLIHFFTNSSGIKDYLLYLLTLTIISYLSFKLFEELNVFKFFVKAKLYSLKKINR